MDQRRPSTRSAGRDCPAGPSGTTQCASSFTRSPTTSRTSCARWLCRKVADDAPRKTGQDRRPDRAPRPIRGVPAGRGGSAAGPVRQDPASHRRPAAIRRRSRHEEPERMNACHPTDEVRAFVIRAQPITTQTPASGVQPRLRGVLAAGGGPSNLANCRCVAHRTRQGRHPGNVRSMSRMVPRSSLLRNGDDPDGPYRNIRSVSRCPVHPGR